MRTFQNMAALLLCLVVTTSVAFAQGSNGVVGGLVQDVTKSSVPGVVITLTNTQTGVVDTKFSNEAGVYNFPSVPPGIYKVTAEIPGFKMSIKNSVQVGTTAQIRVDFTMELGGRQETVQVTASAETALREAGASIGEVLPEYRIRELPLVGNNVLDLLTVLPGFRAGPNATGAADTIGGLGLNTVNATINGLSTVSTRDGAELWGYQTLTTSVVNPDLVGEIRLILAPVDVELGRGNAQVQITTRSGTNKYSGSLVWNIQNSALNANTWGNNNDIVAGVWTPTKPNWQNLHQVTASYGGPIIKNRTFFFALYDTQVVRRRELISNTILTDTARQGIFRYYPGWNPGNVLTAVPQTFNDSATATYPSVDFSGNPVAPAFNPINGQPYSTYPNAGLKCLSVFGDRKMDGTAFTDADCPGGTAVIHSAWDQYRPAPDSTGYIQKVIAMMPHATYWGAGDGLNTAVNRYVRGRRGSSTDAAAIGVVQNSGDYNNRKQINIKIDQNFNSKNRMSVSYSYEKSDGGLPAAWQGGFIGTNSRRPQVLTINATSTLSPTLVNEARFGLNRSSETRAAAWENIADATARDSARALLLTGGKHPTNGTTYPVVFTPTYSGYMNFTAGYQNVSPLWNYADTLRWTHGKHSLSFGAEYRHTGTDGGQGNAYPTMATGSAGAANTVNPIGQNITNFSAELPNLRQTARTAVQTLTYFLNGSVAGASSPYWLQNFADLDNGTWSDVTVDTRHNRSQYSEEYNFFLKDDFKVAKRLTLNLGLRYDFRGSPYFKSGLMNGIVDHGVGLYGAGRSTTGNYLDQWLTPGNLFLTGYGSNPVAPLSCQVGVQQHPNLPVSTCDPNLQTKIQFLGKNSPNPDESLIPEKGRFSPAIGFAWQVPWFGGSTTVRGGFQRTYGGAGSSFTGGLLDGPGGDNLTQTLDFSDPVITAITSGAAARALTIADVQTLVPVLPRRQPGRAFGNAGRSIALGGYAEYDPDYVTPYTDNFTLQVTRNLTRNLTLNVSLVQTMGKKQSGNGGAFGSAGSIDLNTNNVFHNPELFNALERTRRGEDDPLFDTMLLGLNLNTGTALAAAGYAPVGTVGSTGVLNRGSAHIRRAFAANLANGNYNAVVNSIIAANPTAGTAITQGGAQPLPTVLDPTTGATVVAAQRVLRNGCDRIANNLVNGFTVPGGPVISPRCFPENYLIANPQVGAAPLALNYGRSNYQSAQVQFTLRPTQGISVQGTYSFSKTMALPGSGFTDPLNREQDYGSSTNSNGHEFRANGTFELPLGPNKLLFGNSSGWLARAIEKWQTSFTFNRPDGAIVNFAGNTFLYANGRPDIVGPWDNPKGQVKWNGPNNATGTYFGSPGPYRTFRDPQCYNSSLVSPVDSMGFSLQGNCTLNGLAKIVPEGTTGAFQMVDGSGRWLLPVLQNPLPGHQGTLGKNTLRTFSIWSFNANASKTFKLSETKTIQIRIDTTNVLNHPTPNNYTGGFSDNFGQITGKGNQTRTFQAQARLSF